LAAALWLGLYVVTRNRRSLVAWLTFLTLWSMSGLFVNLLLALNPLPVPADFPGWVWLFMPFWRPDSFESGASSWLQGWLLTPAAALWHHATLVLLPGRMTRWRWAQASLGYGVTAAAVGVQAFTPLMFAPLRGDPLYLNTLPPGPLFPVFVALLVLLTIACLRNLLAASAAAPSAILKKQLGLLAAATLVGGLAGPVSAAALVSGLQVPRLVLTLLLGGAVTLIGYGVAQYSALMGGRVLRRDFIYNAVAVGLVAALYLVVTTVSVQAFQVPAGAFIFVMMLAIVTHSVVDVARPALDAMFYQRDARNLRSSLRRLAGTIGENEPLPDRLARSLESLCASVRATFGLVALFEDGGVRAAAACGLPNTPLALAPSQLAADDVLRVAPGQLPPPLAEAALLIPLYDENGQMGALVLGRPQNAVYYSADDIELLLHPADRMADAIRDARREAEHLAALAALAETQVDTAPAEPPQDLVKVVEDALRNLSSFAYLGEHPLAEWKLAHANLTSAAPTFLDRGRAVYGLLAEAVEKLRPASGTPGDPPSREWYAYIIIHSAYLKDVPNRDIMSRLYISEGTFNRTRRAALHALARSLAEAERALAG
jgi:GAF domain-containing protein